MPALSPPGCRDCLPHRVARPPLPDGRRALFEHRVASSLVREGHGDLLAEDVFLLDDGRRSQRQTMSG